MKITLLARRCVQASLLVLVLPALALRAEDKKPEEAPAEAPAAPALPAVLKLTTGRTFAEWSILSETATHVVVRHKGGLAKVAKGQLPPEVLALHPIDDAKAKHEAFVGTLSKQAGEHREAEVVAMRQREIAARRADLAHRPSPRVVSESEMHTAVKARARRYYETERHTGSGSTLVFRTDIELDEPRPIPGWAGEYEVTGVCAYQYYDSVWGGSFSRATGHFSARVDTQRGRVRVTDFTPTTGPAL